MTPALLEALRHVTTGTITTVLLKKGIRRCRMNGPMPLPGLYPTHAQTKAHYEAWKKQR